MAASNTPHIPRYPHTLPAIKKPVVMPNGYDRLNLSVVMHREHSAPFLHDYFLITNAMRLGIAHTRLLVFFILGV